MHCFDRGHSLTKDVEHDFVKHEPTGGNPGGAVAVQRFGKRLVNRLDLGHLVVLTEQCWDGCEQPPCTGPVSLAGRPIWVERDVEGAGAIWCASRTPKVGCGDRYRRVVRAVTMPLQK